MFDTPKKDSKAVFFMTGPVSFINLYQQEEKQGPEKGREYLSLIYF
jgi:hypothetical protein